MSIWQRRVATGTRRLDRRIKLGLYAVAGVAVIIALVLRSATTGSTTGNTVPPGPVAAGPDNVPAPPPGFSLTWSDDFNGGAGTGLDNATWKYDTGRGFGTGEIETMTDSTANVYHDGSGNLVLKA